MADKLIALLVRHGEVEDNEKPIFRGWRNESLEKEGLAEAKASAKKSKKWDIKRIVSSPLFRAVETARAFAEVHGLEIEQNGDLLPFHTGVFTGLDKDDNAEAYDVFMEHPEVPIPNGESMDDVHDRVGRFFKKELKRSAKELTLYSAHSSTGVVLHNVVAGKMEMKPGVEEIVAPGGIVGIYEDGDGYRLEVLLDEQTSPVSGS